MKKITVYLFLFLFSVCIHAQQDVNTSFATQMNDMFGSLDKTKVPNGILLDYGMEFANVPAFNGTLTDSTYTNAANLKQLYNTLLSSRITNTTPAMVTPDVFENNWNNNRTAGVISLCGLYYKYAQIAYNATVNNKLTYSNNQFYDKTINGVWQNPYQELQTFAMTPAIEQYDQLSFQVIIPTALFYTNNNSGVASIAIDFDNGLGYQTVVLGQALTVTYTATGLKNWKYKLNLTNGTTLYSQSKFQIGSNTGTLIEIPLPPKPVCESCKTSVTAVTSTAKETYWKPITAIKDYDGVYGHVKITIDYAGTDQSIKKPLIVAEGFDLGALLNPEKAYGNNTYSATFKKSLEKSGSALRNLIYEDTKQYDIIYVDWDNGADYMQRNAYALEEVIKYVNTEKAKAGSTTPNVVLGQSMGGVIARYALADMEQRGLNHQTGLFISHDAPQQGANIPIAVQYMFRHLTRQYVQVGNTNLGNLVTIPVLDKFGASNYVSILDAPASKQLVANFVDSNYANDNTVNTSFYNELKTKGLTNSGGYPLQCRNVAISNGSECGTIQSFNPGDDLVNVNYNKGLSFWGDLASLIYNPLGASIAGELINKNFYGIAILGSIPGNSKYKADFQVKSLYTTSGNEIYKGRLSYTKKIAWLFNVTVNITDVSKNQPAGILPFDTYGGGYFDTKAVAGAVTVSGLYVRDRFGFIPTASALDIGQRNIALDDTDYKKSYVGAIAPVAPKNSPFANFISDFDRSNPNASNKNHISFNDRNGDWIVSELNALNNPSITPEKANCSYMCSDFEIAGNAILCGSGTYSVPITASCNWTITEGANLVTITGNGTNTITITPTAVGRITLTLNLGNKYCGYKTLTKSISVNPNSNTPLPIPSGEIIIGDWSCGEDGAIPISFEPNPPFNNGIVSYSPQVMAHPSRPRNFDFTVTYTNPCNGATSKKIYKLSTPAPCANTARTANLTQTNTFKIFPNPSSNIINISLFDETMSPSPQTPITAVLYDLNGQEKRSVTVVNNTAAINVNNLKKGIYILKISIDGVIESHQVIVE